MFIAATSLEEATWGLSETLFARSSPSNASRRRMVTIKRNQQRLIKVYPVILTVLSAQGAKDVYYSHTLNISPSGCCVAVPFYLEPGTQVMVAHGGFVERFQVEWCRLCGKNNTKLAHQVGLRKLSSDGDFWIEKDQQDSQPGNME
jgi:hypothetical protein